MNLSLGKIDEQDTNPESHLKKIAHAIIESTDKYFPIKQVERREPKKSWITNRIKRHIANKDELYQLWIKTKSNKYYAKYKKKRNEVNMKIKEAKRNEIQIELDHNISEERFRYVQRH